MGKSIEDIQCKTLDGPSKSVTYIEFSALRLLQENIVFIMKSKN